jgi:hypothetical protein
MKKFILIVICIFLTLLTFAQTKPTKNLEQKTTKFYKLEGLSESHLIQDEGYEFEIKRKSKENRFLIHVLKTPENSAPPEAMTLKLYKGDGSIEEIELSTLTPQNIDKPFFSTPNKNLGNTPQVTNSNIIGVQLKFKISNTK